MRRSPRRTPDIGGDCVERWRQLPFLRYAPCHFSRGFLAQDVAVAVAHAGDETVGCGALLSRLSAVPVIVAADAVPDAREQRARRAEWSAALELAAIPENRRVTLGFPEDRAAEHIVPLAHALADTFRVRKSHVVLTHAYEGGHPDYDAMALAVHLAARILRPADHKLFIFEMPFCRLGDDGRVYQSFCPEIAPDIAIPLSAAEQERKSRMLASFVSRGEALAPFTLDAERFRAAPSYPFPKLPNDGRLYYEHRDCGMTGERWQSVAAAALEEIAAETVG